MRSQATINRVALYTIARREATRVFRIWTQTLLPSPVTAMLYLTIFGQVIGQRLGTMDNVNYLLFLIPGLMMNAMITNCYSNVSSSFFSVKFARNIEEMLVASLSPWVILTGFCFGGVLRGLLVLGIVSLISLYFAPLHVAHLGYFLGIVVLSSILFSVAGFINGLFARKFDDVSLIPTFVLTPLIYVGGVFYSIDLLPPFWRSLSQLNPIFYIVNGFRASMLGESDVSMALSFWVTAGFTTGLTLFALALLYKGVGLKD